MRRYRPRSSNDTDERVCPRGHYMTRTGPHMFKCFHCKTPIHFDTWGDRVEEERSQPERPPTDRGETR